MRIRTALSRVRWTREVMKAALLVGAALSMVNCFKDPLTPVPPSWDVNLTFPLAVKNVTMDDVIHGDSTSLTSDASNRIIFSSVINAVPVPIGTQLSFVPTSANAQIQLGAFAVNANPIIAKINPSSIPPGSRTFIPAGTLICPDFEISSSTSEGVTFKSGTIGLSLKNNMPIAIVPTQPVTLMDDQGKALAEFNFEQQSILPGHVGVCYSDLAGVTFGGHVVASGLSFSTPGSQGAVTFPPDSMLVASFSFTNAMASAARLSSVPAQRLIDNDRTTVLLDDSTMVNLIGMRSGTLHFDFSNRIDVGVQFKFRLENLYRQIGGSLRQYEDSVYLSASKGGSYDMDLTGCEFHSAQGRLLNAIDITSSVIIPVAVNQTVAIHDTDKVTIAMASTSPIVVDTVNGALKPTWVNINSAVGINKGMLPSKLKGQFVIPSASMVFTALSGVGYPADLYLSFSATRPNGGLATLTIPAGQRRIMPGSSSITFDPSEVGKFLSQFSNGLPDSLHITGKVLINPPDVYTTDPLKTGGLSSACTFGGSMAISIPLTIGIAQATYRDTVAFGLAEDGSNKKPVQDQLKNINTAKLHIEVQNGLPADVSVRVHVLDAMHHEILCLPQSGGMLDIGGASLDPQGFAALPTSSSLEIDLNHAEAQQYNAAEYVDYEVHLQTSQSGSIVSFRTSDLIHVRVWTECSMGVNK